MRFAPHLRSFSRCAARLSRPLFALMIALAVLPAAACTSILVSRGASVDGSVMITYCCDEAGHYCTLSILPAADHKPGEMIEVKPRQEAKATRGKQGRIPQVPHTYQVFSNLMNEHQVSMSETTFGGRHEAINPDGLFTYETLMSLGLQRARTAREAIRVMTQLVDKYGYGDEGESISVADPNEAWILEIVGSGQGGKGAVWVAARVPDGSISCHCNQARIGEIPRNDPANWLYSDNVESFAVSKGWYNPKSGEPFRFFDAYCPPSPMMRRVCDTRVWSILRRAAPSQHFSPDYHRAKPGSKPYPLFVKPDAKLSTADVFALVRDHFEGTEFDMTKGPDAGPYGLPRRWRPLAWKVDGVQYAWERPISTQQTGFTSVTQSRSWMPDAVGGVVWYGLDDSYTSCFVPFYCGIDALPPSFTGGSIQKFSWDSAWWVFNFTANYAYGRYSLVVPEIRAAQKDIESNLSAIQPAVEKTAVELINTSPTLSTRYLTDYSVMHAEQTVVRWRALAEHLVTKYNDGYVRGPDGKYPDIGYPDAWLRRVLRERPEQYRVPKEKPATSGH
ncbi:MAG: C69 family dipeptidase [Thermoguttaceae bacterium]